METQHTPIPWKTQSAPFQKHIPPFWQYHVVSGGLRIANVAGNSQAEAQANCELIAKAVNCHQELISFIQMLIDGAEGKISDKSEDQLIRDAKALIAKAESK